MKTRRELLRYCIATASSLAATKLAIGANATHMENNTTAHNLIVALRSIEKDVCSAAANELLAASDGTSVITLHLRSAGLDTSDADILAKALSLPSQGNNQRIRSFSVSFNPFLGDRGTIALVNSLPLDISELGFVGCDIGDEGGEALLGWAKKSTHLRMICVEGNLFSDITKAEFRKLSKLHPGLLTVV
jgi:hypothetical protein